MGGQRAVGRGEAAAQRRGGDEVQVVGQRYDVEVGRRYGDQLGEGPGQVKPGCDWSGHTWASPAAQYSHRPHPQTNGTVTRSPTRRVVTWGPMAAMTPAYS